MVASIPVTERAYTPASLKDTLSCPICLDDFHPGEIIYGHNNQHECHPICLKRWMITPDSAEKCPICRQKLSLKFEPDPQLHPFDEDTARRIIIKNQLAQSATLSNLRYFPERFIPEDLRAACHLRINIEKFHQQEQWKKEKALREKEIDERNAIVHQRGARIIALVGLSAMVIYNVYNYFRQPSNG